eukprot:Platyproteum_vivax@DN6181_c0_g2_i2.p1
MEKLNLKPWLVEMCKTMSVTWPTPIQCLTIPPILEKNHVIGFAETGSGKTACFCLPILDQLSENPYGIFSLVLEPTRELAMQTADHFRAFGNTINVQVCTIVGGEDMRTQLTTLVTRPHIVVATPGRLGQLLEENQTELFPAFQHLKVLVFDESDHLFQKNFEPDMGKILTRIPSWLGNPLSGKRQTLFFCATMTLNMKALKDYGFGEEKIEFYDAHEDTQLSTRNIDQKYIFLPAQVRYLYLVHLLSTLEDLLAGHQCIVFTSTVYSCQLITIMLQKLHFSVTCVHSLQIQRERVACLAKFRCEKSRILVATDVASRGLDLPKVRVVINCFMARTSDDYIHRIGRTGRAGRKGTAITFVTERDVDMVHTVEKALDVKLTKYDVDEEEVLTLLTRVGKAKQKASLLLHEIGFEEKVDRFRETKAFRRESRLASEANSQPPELSSLRVNDAPPAEAQSVALVSSNLKRSSDHTRKKRRKRVKVQDTSR